MKVILASQSKNRQGILKVLGIDYEVVPSNIDEDIYDDLDSKKRVVAIARAKARFVAQEQKKAVIVAADTFALYRNQILNKPKFKMEALEVLTMLSGKSHVLLTGWVVLNSKTGKEYNGLSETRVTFRKIGKQELLNYVNDNSVTFWAAGYNPNNTSGVSFVEKIEGSLTGFMHGLPMEKVVPALRKEMKW